MAPELAKFWLETFKASVEFQVPHGDIEGQWTSNETLQGICVTDAFDERSQQAPKA